MTSTESFPGRAPRSRYHSGIKTRVILTRLLRTPRFWMLVAAGLGATLAVELAVGGEWGRWIGNFLFLATVFAAGAMVRQAAGLPPGRERK